MTETFSLFVYVLVLYWSLLYVRDRRILQLAVVQALSVVLIGFRMSYLLVVLACTILLPLIAFGLAPMRAIRNQSDLRRPGPLTTGFAHVVASLAIMLLMHGAYKQVYGKLRKRESAYLHDAGAHLVALWAPALEPDDATDPRFRELISEGDKFKLKDLHLRNAQLFGKGFLIDRWRQIENNRKKSDLVAKETAMNALRRRPLQIVGLAIQTYTGYWGIASIQSYAREDLGYGELTEEQVKVLAEKLRFITAKLLPSQPFSLLQRYFLAGWPYYFIVVISPLTCALAAWISRQRAFAFLLFLHASILMVVITALSGQACIRYLQPISLLTLLSIAICVDWFAGRASPAAMQSAA
jgi:hypothetical protein